MLLEKKKLPFLTLLILLIFSSEIINTISKLLQLIKYYFPDKRDLKYFTSGNTARGVICQIQIVTAIYSDFCSLLTSLLLSLRCYDVIKNRKRFFDRGNMGILFIIFTIIISLFFAIIFLLFDKKYTQNNIPYRYDLRDRCSYWCWLEHIPSLILFSIYLIILIFNIFFAFKTYSYLKKGYEKLKGENEVFNEKAQDIQNDLKTPLNEGSKDKNSKSELSETSKSSITNEEDNRIKELRLMKIKCFIYPLVTIILWSFITLYRIVDDLFMNNFDSLNRLGNNDMEKKSLEKYPAFLMLVKIFLVIHTFLSATRGIFYGLSFIKLSISVCILFSFNTFSSNFDFNISISILIFSASIIFLRSFTISSFFSKNFLISFKNTLIIL